MKNMLTPPFSNMSTQRFSPECSSVGFTIRYILQMSCSTATYIVGKEGPSRAHIFRPHSFACSCPEQKKVFLKFFFSPSPSFTLWEAVRGIRRRREKKGKNEKDCSPSLTSLVGEEESRRKRGKREGGTLE